MPSWSGPRLSDQDRIVSTGLGCFVLCAIVTVQESQIVLGNAIQTRWGTHGGSVALSREKARRRKVPGLCLTDSIGTTDSEVP